MSRPFSAESVFRAAAHPSRRRILQLLAKSELAATEIARHFSHAQPTLSRHLRVLQQAGLVSSTARGTRVIYQLEARPLSAMTQWLREVTARDGARRAR
jgi:DNA-binding transcriptional ArsR family regulator